MEASDFLPTLADLAGRDLPADWSTDGVSFAPALLGRMGPRRDAAFFWYDPRPGWDKERFTRSVFALDHRYKLFSDGRFFEIEGEGFREEALDPERRSPEARRAHRKLERFIEKQMRPPMSPAARREVDAYGNPL